MATCPSCHARQMTNVKHEPNTKTHLMALLICIVGWVKLGQLLSPSSLLSLSLQSKPPVGLGTLSNSLSLSLAFYFIAEASVAAAFRTAWTRARVPHTHAPLVAPMLAPFKIKQLKQQITINVLLNPAASLRGCLLLVPFFVLLSLSLSFFWSSSPTSSAIAYVFWPRKTRNKW